MLKKVKDTMDVHCMTDFKSVLVGLSGGADSVALTHILCALSKEYGFRVYAAHVNHGIRGSSADRDEHFSEQLAESLGVKFFSLKADVRSVAAEKGISEELAGREVRYRYFDSLCEEYNIDCIATAHHKNDNAETVIMNFMRGSGLKGLCGIPYKRDNIIRPILDCSRADIEEYCKANGLEYVTDETNCEDNYTRNRIRNLLIPTIQKLFNPSVVDTITRNSELITLDEEFLSGEADKVYAKSAADNVLDISALGGAHKAIILRVIRKMTDSVCGNRDVSQSVIMSVYELLKNNRTGTKTDVVRGVEARIEYGKLVIAEKTAEAGEFSYQIILGEKTYIPELNCSVLAEKADGYEKDGAEYFSVPEGASLCIRNRRKGDAFIPSGMTGTKKLKQFMIDRKIPRDKRDLTGIFTVDGEIAWVMGYRRSEKFKFKEKGIKIILI